jgi:hypothetical protein
MLGATPHVLKYRENQQHVDPQYKVPDVIRSFRLALNRSFVRANQAGLNFIQRNTIQFQSRKASQKKRGPE